MEVDFAATGRTRNLETKIKTYRRGNWKTQLLKIFVDHMENTGGCILCSVRGLEEYAYEDMDPTHHIIRYHFENGGHPIKNQAGKARASGRNRKQLQ